MTVRLSLPDFSKPGERQESPEFETVIEAAEWLYRNWGATLLAGQVMALKIQNMGRDDEP